MRAAIISIAGVGSLLSLASFLYLGLFILSGWASGGPLLQAGIILALLTTLFVNLWLINHRRDILEESTSLKPMAVLSLIGSLGIMAFWLWPLLIS